MKTALLSVQGAIYNTLTNDTSVMRLVNGVYDRVPSDTSFPYIALGEDTATPNDTKTNTGEEITHTLHVWSNYEGKKEAKEIMNAVLGAFDGSEMTLSDGSTIELSRRDYMNVIDDPSGLYHGVIRLRFTIKH